MGRLEELTRSLGANAGESMGEGRVPANRNGSPQPPAGPNRYAGIKAAKGTAEIPLDKIDRDPDQPREEFDPESLGRLAESLRIRGQLQPIRVRWDEGRGVYLIVCGERRWRAAKLAGLATLTAVVTDGLSAGELLAVQLVENALREDLRPVEQAKAYRSLMESQGWSGHQLARELHVSQTAVVRALSLLDLPAEIQSKVERGELPATTAAEIARLPTDEQAGVAEAVVSAGLSRAEVSQVVAAVRAKRPTPAARPEPFVFDAGGAVIRVSWRKADGPNLVQALRKALKAAQERDGAAA